MSRYKPSIALLLLFVSLPLTALEPWAASFGTHPRYRLPRYITGFSAVEKRERDALESARLRALDDLVRKVQVSVRSELVSESRDDGRRSAGSFSSITRSTSELNVAQPRFLVDEDSTRYYALAYVEIEELSASYFDSLEEGVDVLQREAGSLEEHLEAGRLALAEESLRRVTQLTETITSQTGVLKSLARLARESTGNMIRTDLDPYEQLAGNASILVRDASGRIRDFIPASFEELLEVLTAPLDGAQKTLASHIPLRFENTDFTSEFGVRLSQALASRIRASSADGQSTGDAILEGSYWVDDETIEVMTRLRDPQTGEVLLTSRVEANRSAAGSRDLQPLNAESARASQQTLIGDAVVDGGLSAEVWTNKGRDQDILAFEEGEEVQFYFRVNQPAHLRLTYQLASGEMVLLEPDFFIGSDRVNRIVALPYTFTVVPPFGVERLIVTGFSSTPPPAETVIRTIGGQQYEVYGTPEAPLVRTRGLARTQASSDTATRVGEATITMTTVRAVP